MRVPRSMGAANHRREIHRIRISISRTRANCACRASFYVTDVGISDENTDEMSTKPYGEGERSPPRAPHAIGSVGRCWNT
jgi:hypothetical protein